MRMSHFCPRSTFLMNYDYLSYTFFIPFQVWRYISFIKASHFLLYMICLIYSDLHCAEQPSVPHMQPLILHFLCARNPVCDFLVKRVKLRPNKSFFFPLKTLVSCEPMYISVFFFFFAGVSG